MSEKRCSKCKQELALTEFHKNKSRVDGLADDCKECTKRRAREWRANNRQKHRKYSTKWKVDNRGRARELEREHRNRNYDSLLEKSRVYREENREKIAAYSKSTREKNPEKFNARESVMVAVRRNDLPPASGLVCEYCQEAQGQQYHHHNGYGLEHALDVVALCIKCHGKAHRKEDHE